MDRSSPTTTHSCTATYLQTPLTNTTTYKVKCTLVCIANYFVADEDLLGQNVALLQSTVLHEMLQITTDIQSHSNRSLYHIIQLISMIATVETNANFLPQSTAPTQLSCLVYSCHFSASTLSECDIYLCTYVQGMPTHTVGKPKKTFSK